METEKKHPTVKDIVAQLLTLNQDAPVVTSGKDDGGYDWTWKQDILIYEEDGKVYITGDGEDIFV